MLSLRHNIVRLLTVALLFTLGHCATASAQNASDLRLVPFPKEVTMKTEQWLSLDAGQGFSLKEPLVLMVSAKDRDTLGASILDELKRAGGNIATGNSSEPEVSEIDSDLPMLSLGRPGTLLFSQPIFDRDGEGRVAGRDALVAGRNAPSSDSDEAYQMEIYPNGIVCQGASDAGLYYAVQTLRQLIRANVDDNGNLPCLAIRDWPSMKYRCFQDDWTRGPSPQLATLYHAFDLGSQLKHNMFTYYMENQFEYKKHPKLNPQDGTMTQEEFRQCVEYAAKRRLIMLGNQQSFGHHYKTIAIPEYAHLGEAGYILSPVVEEVYSFLDDLYSEILPLQPFEMFNVCCDETWDLAKSGASKELADKIGVAGVYVQHILRVRELLQKYDKRMLMWGDIIMNHPDKLDLIPKDVVMMCWDYAPRADFDAYIKPFSESGYEFFVCPGQSNWSVMLPLIRAYTVNIQNFVRDGCANGAIGMLNTGWEDDGEALHGYTWHAIGWGAECAWNASKTDPADFNKRIGAVLFGAKGDDFGRAMELLEELQVAPELGSAYNGRFWERDFIPRQAPAVVEKRAKRILELVQPAIKHLEITKDQATVNAELLDSFLFGARRMELIALRMLDGLDMSRRYAAAAELDLTNTEQKKLALGELENIATIIDKNRKTHHAFKSEFVRIWNSESKPYSLDRVTKKYDDLDAWFDELQQKIGDVITTITEGNTEAALPDIGLSSDLPMRKTSPSRVVTRGLSPDTPWARPKALLRLGLTVEAGNVDRTTFPIELDLNLPESCIGKKVEAFELGAYGLCFPIPAQLESANHPQKPQLQRLTLLIGGREKEETAKVYVYFGLDNVDTAVASLPSGSTYDGDNGMKVIDNNPLMQIHLGAEGGHVYKWLLKDFDTGRILLDMTDPGDDSYHGFSDHGHGDRSKRFDLVCMNDGPAMVRYGCYFDGELVKTLTVYGTMPILDVITTDSTGYYWNFDDPDLFAADGKTPGTYLFSNGTTGPTPPKGASNDLQIRESGVYWAIKTNEQGFVHGMTTPEARSRFVIGPGGGMGGVGIEGSEARSHFVTLAWRLEQGMSADFMEQIRETYNLKNQPVVIQYAQEIP